MLNMLMLNRDILNGEIVAGLTGWQAISIAAVTFVVAALLRRLRRRV